MAQKTFNGKIFRAVDGDTFIYMVNLGFDTYREVRLRIFGIDCPAVNSSDPEEKKIALKAKELAKSFEGKEAVIFIHGIDNYGRTVADLSINDVDFGAMMISQGLAKRLEKMHFSA